MENTENEMKLNTEDRLLRLLQETYYTHLYPNPNESKNGSHFGKQDNIQEESTLLNTINDITSVIDRKMLFKPDTNDFLITLLCSIDFKEFPISIMFLLSELLQTITKRHLNGTDVKYELTHDEKTILDHLVSFAEIINIDKIYNDNYNIIDGFGYSLSEILDLGIESINNTISSCINNIILRINDSKTTFFITYLHSVFFKACYFTKQYYLTKGITFDHMDISPNISSLALLEFLYYKLENLIGLKEFNKALTQSITILALPTKKVHELQIKSYNKFMFLSLIEFHTILKMPSFINSKVLSAIGKINVSYNYIKIAYESQSIQAFQALILSSKSKLINDDNFELAEECINSLIDYKISLLSRVYSSIFLDDAAQKIGIDNTLFLNHLTNLISLNIIKGNVDINKKIINFHITNENNKMKNNSNEDNIKYIKNDLIKYTQSLLEIA